MREFVISDIHGQYKAFLDVLRKARFKEGRDTLYVLGDMIDWGTQSIKVLQYIRHMPNCKPLLGNHELLCLSSLLYNNSLAMECWAHNMGKDTYNAFAEMPKEASSDLLQWMASLPSYYVLDKYYLTHSSVIKDRPDNNDSFTLSFMHAETMPKAVYTSIWRRVIPETVPHDTNKILISGHSRTCTYHNSFDVYFDLSNNYINIDCGAKGIGRMNGSQLALLQLGTHKVWYSRKES